MTQIVAVDIGGTHARFALAEIADGRVLHLGPATVLETAEHPSIKHAWAAFARIAGPLPRAAAVAIAAAVQGEVIHLTNNAWTIHPALLAEQLEIDDPLLINDFGAVAHAIAHLAPEHLRHLFGPSVPLPAEAVVSIVGPGTGLGVAQLLRDPTGYRVIETEGGHTDFAPLDAIEGAMLVHLRPHFGRVSIERIVSGPGLLNIYRALAAIEGRVAPLSDDRALWAAAFDGSDSLAAAAFDRFLLCLGAAAGDIALAHGAGALVLAGGLGQRIADRLVTSGFHHRFTTKGRFARWMEAMPIKLITHPQPGLLGAAAAFAKRSF